MKYSQAGSAVLLTVACSIHANSAQNVALESCLADLQLTLSHKIYTERSTLAMEATANANNKNLYPFQPKRSEIIQFGLSGRNDCYNDNGSYDENIAAHKTRIQVEKTKLVAVEIYLQDRIQLLQNEERDLQKQEPNDAELLSVVWNQIAIAESNLITVTSLLRNQEVVLKDLSRNIPEGGFTSFKAFTDFFYAFCQSEKDLGRTRFEATWSAWSLGYSWLNSYCDEEINYAEDEPLMEIKSKLQSRIGKFKNLSKTSVLNQQTLAIYEQVDRFVAVHQAKLYLNTIGLTMRKIIALEEILGFQSDRMTDIGDVVAEQEFAYFVYDHYNSGGFISDNFAPGSLNLRLFLFRLEYGSSKINVHHSNPPPGCLVGYGYQDDNNQNLPWSNDECEGFKFSEDAFIDQFLSRFTSDPNIDMTGPEQMLRTEFRKLVYSFLTNDAMTKRLQGLRSPKTLKSQKHFWIWVDSILDEFTPFDVVELKKRAKGGPKADSSATTSSQTSEPTSSPEAPTTGKTKVKKMKYRVGEIELEALQQDELVNQLFSVVDTGALNRRETVVTISDDVLFDSSLALENEIALNNDTISKEILSNEGPIYVTTSTDLVSGDELLTTSYDDKSQVAPTEEMSKNACVIL